jgi:hypothetical protein
MRVRLLVMGAKKPFTLLTAECGFLCAHPKTATGRNMLRTIGPPASFNKIGMLPTQAFRSSGASGIRAICTTKGPIGVTCSTTVNVMAAVNVMRITHDIDNCETCLRLDSGLSLGIDYPENNELARLRVDL